MGISRACFGALLGAAVAVSQLAALSPAAAAVYSPQQALSAQTIQDFLANPRALLTQYPDGGPQMISRVRDLAASDPSTLNAIVGLLATANAMQSTAIGTGLGQVALMAVRTDQAYANQIQEAIAGAVKRHNVGPVGGAGAGSSQQKIGNAVKTIDQVEGVTEKGTQPVSAGSEIYVNELVRTGVSGKAELLFADRTNLTVGPVTTIRLDKFVYDPSGGSGNVVLEVGLGSFRFITGLQDPRNYEIHTRYATMGIRGTQFFVNITSTGLTIQVTSGTVTVTTSTGTYTVSAGQELTVSANGSVQGPTATPPGQQDQFADLGPPTTNISLADALDAFSAATGTSATGAAGAPGGGAGGAGGGGGGTGGGGGSITGFGTTGGLGGAGFTPNFSTFAVNTPSNFFTLGFTLVCGQHARYDHHNNNRNDDSYQSCKPKPLKPVPEAIEVLGWWRARR